VVKTKYRDQNEKVQNVGTKSVFMPFFYTKKKFWVLRWIWWNNCLCCWNLESRIGFV